MFVSITYRMNIIQEVYQEGYQSKILLNNEIRKSTGLLRKTSKLIGNKQERVYFLAGLPLQYWSFGGEMGLKAVDPKFIKRGWLPSCFEWQTTEHSQKYKLLEGIPTFYKWYWYSSKRGELQNRVYGSNELCEDEYREHNNYVRFLIEKEQEFINSKI